LVLRIGKALSSEQGSKEEAEELSIKDLPRFRKQPSRRTLGILLLGNGRVGADVLAFLEGRPIGGLRKFGPKTIWVAGPNWYSEPQKWIERVVGLRSRMGQPQNPNSCNRGRRWVRRFFGVPLRP
jgi:hypothetical protein